MAKITDIQSIIMEMASQQKTENQYMTAGNTALNQSKHEVHEVVKIPESRYTYGNNKDTVKSEENKAAATAIFSSKRHVTGNVEDLLRSFVEGKDFIKLPQGQKVLLKTACYKIINFYNMRVKVDLIDKKIEPSSDLIAYTVSVKLVNEEGSVQFEALSSANSTEKRFKAGGIANDSTVIVMAQSRGLRTCARWLLHS